MAYSSAPTTVSPSLISTTPFATSLPLTQKNTTPLVPATKTEKKLTTADQESGSRDERLNSIIQSNHDGWIGGRFLSFVSLAYVYSLLRFCQHVSRVKTTTIIRFKAKIQGK
jgi:hypothetical protein